MERVEAGVKTKKDAIEELERQISHVESAYPNGARMGMALVWLTTGQARRLVELLKWDGEKR